MEARAALQPYLDFANLLDQSRELPAPYTLVGGVHGLLFDELRAKAREQFPVPPDVQSKMKKRGRGRIVGWLPDPSAPGGGWRLDILFLYETFYAVRETARRVADTLSKSPTNRPVSSIPIPPRAGMLKVRDDGTVQRWHGVYEGFLAQLERVDARRISRCPICGKLYYAWRSDKGACSPKCCNNWNVLKSRSPEKATQYKISRIREAEARVKNTESSSP